MPETGREVPGERRAEMRRVHRDGAPTRDRQRSMLRVPPTSTCGDEHEPHVEAARGVTDEVDRPLPLGRRARHRAGEHPRAVPERRRGRRGDVFADELHTRRGEALLEPLPHVREIVVARDTTEAEQAGNEIHAVKRRSHSGHSRLTTPVALSSRRGLDDLVEELARLARSHVGHLEPFGAA